MADPRTPRKKIFISYSHRDEAWFTELKKRLLPMQRVHGFEIWDDKHLLPGQDWHTEIQKALGDTKLALLLVSSDFMASEYIDKHELKPLQDAHERGEGVTVVPLYLSKTDVDDYPFITRLQGLNDPARPLERVKEKQADLDDEFVAISRKIKALMQAPAAAAGATSVATPGVALGVAPGIAPGVAHTARSSTPSRRTAEPVDDGADEEAGIDDGADDTGDDGDGQPMNEMFAEQLQAMFEEDGQQALVIGADDSEETTLLLMVTEGADDNLICEIAANDELHPDLRLDRKTTRLLIEEWSFLEPEVRGDRLWKDFGPIDDIDVDELGADLAALLETAFGVPSEDFAVTVSMFDV